MGFSRFPFTSTRVVRLAAASSVFTAVTQNASDRHTIESALNRPLLAPQTVNQSSASRLVPTKEDTDMSDYDHSYHIWDRPIKKVAVIGSGPSGTPAARQLMASGLDVTVFERQPQPGGIWNWRPESTAPLSIPTPPPSVAAFTPVARGRQGSRQYSDPSGDDQEKFNPTNPVYWTLTNNVPTTTMAFKDFPYPLGTNQNISHTLISNYVRSYAAHFGVDKVTSYNTRVETVDKVQVGSKEHWRLRLRKLEDVGTGQLREAIWEELFDAVVVATGHYNAPKIPDIRGVDNWAAAYPDRIIHSQGYRTPERFAGKNVMIVGIGTSGADIARDLGPHVNKLYMVGREIKNGPAGYQAMRRMQRLTLPKNAEQVAEINQFADPQHPDIRTAQVQLKDGRIVSDIDHVIFATGYQYSYPFLSHLHIDPGSKPTSGFDFPLVTDGSSVDHLYRDVFYLPDPTLAFVGLSVNTSAFSFFEYQSIAIARVWARQAALPNFARRWRYYNNKRAETGGGFWMHFMGQEGERRYVKETVEWLNNDAQWSGAPPVEGHTDEWLKASAQNFANIAKKYGLTEEQVKLIRAGPVVQETAKEETARKVREAMLSRTRDL